MTIKHPGKALNPKKILVIRFSSIGDIVLTTPIIRCLKKQLNCELHVLTKAAFSPIYLTNPHIDKVHHFREKLSEIEDVLKNEAFDFIVDLQKNFRSSMLRRKLSAPGSGFPKLNKQKWLLVNFKVDNLPSVHIVDRYFEAVKTLGVKNDNKGLDFFIPDKDLVVPESLNPVLAEKYIGFVIGAKHNTKIFPNEKIISLLNEIKQAVVLLGGPSDKERGEAIVRAVGKPNVVNACGLFNLNQSASLIQQAAVLVSNDTGLMHIAAALEKPIISLWGNTVPKFGMYPYMPGRENISFISEVSGLKCRPCSKLGHKKCPKKHFRCMIDQDEETLLKKIAELGGF